MLGFSVVRNMGFLDDTRAFRRLGCGAFAALMLLGAACSYGWDELDPRLGTVLNSAEGGTGSENEVAGTGGKGGTGGNAGNGGVGGAGGSGGTGAGPRDASVDPTAQDASVDHSQVPDATEDTVVSHDAPEDVTVDVPADAPSIVCPMNSKCLCIEFVYQSPCCKTDGTCGCMTNFPPGPCK